MDMLNVLLYCVWLCLCEPTLPMLASMFEYMNMEMMLTMMMIATTKPLTSFVNHLYIFCANCIASHVD